MNRFPAVPATLALLLFFGAVPAHAQDEFRSERVQFQKGAASAVVKGRLKGYASVDYLVRAGAGQTIVVSLKPSNRSTYFNLLPPGSKDVAMYAAQTGEDYTGILPADGDYAIASTSCAPRRAATGRATTP